MKVFQRLAQAFKAEGTQAVFGIMGARVITRSKTRKKQRF